MIHVWLQWKEGHPPPMIFMHCNEGKNRCPALFCALLAKFHGQRPSTLAMILSESREIHKMYRHTRANVGQFAVGKARATWANMWAIYDWPPFMIPYRKESERGHQPHRGAVERNPSCFTFVKPAELGQPFWSTKKAKLTVGRSLFPGLWKRRLSSPISATRTRLSTVGRLLSDLLTRRLSTRIEATRTRLSTVSRRLSDLLTRLLTSLSYKNDSVILPMTT